MIGIEGLDGYQGRIELVGISLKLLLKCAVASQRLNC